ncbi:MAG: hypothetical protein HYX38_03670 [Rhodospirillales bacterium]|nr:hypothetical protein [Rhodospirillales bacterium]
MVVRLVAIGIVGMLWGSSAFAQSWQGSVALAPNAPSSCPAGSGIFNISVNGSVISVTPPQAQEQRGTVGADGNFTLAYQSPLAGVGHVTVSGNVQSKDVRLALSGVPNCPFVVRPLPAGAQAKTLKACGRSTTYTLVPPEPGAPPKLAAFAGAWVGNMALACAAAVFGQPQDPDAVDVILIVGKWSASGGATSIGGGLYRMSGKFAGDRVVASDGRFTSEFILRSPGEIAFNSTSSFQTNSGLLKRQ